MATLEQRPSLVTLPAEVRMMIYKHRLEGVVRLLKARKANRVKPNPLLPKYDNIYTLFDENDRNGKRIPAIFKVNQLIRHEVLPLIRALPHRFHASTLSHLKFLTDHGTVNLTGIKFINVRVQAYKTDEPHSLLKIFEALPSLTSVTITHQTPLSLDLDQIFLDIRCESLARLGRLGEFQERIDWEDIEERMMEHCGGTDLQEDLVADGLQEGNYPGRTLEATFALNAEIYYTARIGSRTMSMHQMRRLRMTYVDGHAEKRSLL